MLWKKGMTSPLIGCFVLCARNCVNWPSINSPMNVLATRFKQWPSDMKLNGKIDIWNLAEIEKVLVRLGAGAVNL